jgi:hypothetical protein
MNSILPKTACAVCLTVLALVAGSCREEQVTRESVVVTLDSLEQKLLWLDYRIGEETWRRYTVGHSDSLEFFERFRGHVLSDPKSFAALERGRNLIEDDETLRRFDILGAVFRSEWLEQLPVVSELRDSLSAAIRTYEGDFEGALRPLTDLRETYLTDRERTRREAAYRAIGEAGAKLADSFERLFRLRNQHARKAGYNSYFALLLSGRNAALREHLDLLARVDSLTETPYGMILDRLREQSQPVEIEAWDLPFMISGTRREMAAYLPVDSQMGYVHAGLADIGFDPDQLPIYMQVSTRQDTVPYAHSLMLRGPYDQRLIANVNSGLNSAELILSELGHLLHTAHVTEDDPLFAARQYAPWKAGVGHLFASLCRDTTWLRRYPRVPGPLATEFLWEDRERSIVLLRLQLVDLMFEYEAYKNPHRDLNELYWGLFERYMLLQRHDGIQLWAANTVFIDRPLALHDDLLGRIIAAQTLAYLRQTSGVVVGNPESRSFLVQNYFRFGSRYDWRELLQRGTGESLTPEYLLELPGESPPVQ